MCFIEYAPEDSHTGCVGGNFTAYIYLPLLSHMDATLKIIFLYA